MTTALATENLKIVVTEGLKIIKAYRQPLRTLKSGHLSLKNGR